MFQQQKLIRQKVEARVHETKVAVKNTSLTHRVVN